MEGNVDVRVLNYLCTKILYLFLSVYNVFFCKAPTKKTISKWYHQNF
jgi:hypothetical protein